METAYLVVDLGFGDAGKGSIVDYLAQTRGVSAIIRYTGGPHAAHHVVRADGTSHAFCQFGATFKAGVRSHLARGVIVKPENLLQEARTLEEKGFANPLAWLSINPLCRVVTSYHAMLCQMKEVSRGAARRGTVGIGAGEAVRESEENPDLALRVIDLYDPYMLRQKLIGHFERIQCQAQALLRETASQPCAAELRGIYDSFITQVRLKQVQALYHRFAEELPLALCVEKTLLEQCADQPGDLIFEGAHAALLDHDRGYYPYVAKTNTTTAEAEHILDQCGFSGERRTLGVVRTLGYRHGPGPFVSEDPRLSGVFVERHNRENAWQGAVRYGWFDLLAIRHGISLNPRVDAIALTMLDQLSAIGPFQVCLSYEYIGHDFQHLEAYFETSTTPSGRVKITAIKPVPTHRTDALANLLFDCVPWDWLPFDGGQNAVDHFLRFLESPDGLGLPVQIVSSGPARQEKQERTVQAGTFLR